MLTDAGLKIVESRLHTFKFDEIGIDNGNILILFYKGKAIYKIELEDDKNLCGVSGKFKERLPENSLTSY